MALVLDEIGVLMELLGENRYKARAFAAAARAMDEIEGDVAALARSGELVAVRGFGPATARVAREIVETGDSRLHRELRQRTPVGLVDMLGVPGLGATRIHRLHAELGIETLEDLASAAREGRIAELSGFGPRTQEKILEGIGFVRSSSGRRRQPAAYDAAARVIGYLEGRAGGRVKLAGELRRRMETVDGVDVLVEGDGDATAALDAFLRLPGLAAAERTGDGGARGRLADGLEIRVGSARADAFGAAWIRATGSESHLAALERLAAERGLRYDGEVLSRDGEPLPADDEEDVYAALGLAWIEPELREGLGEVEQAAAGTLPRLVDSSDLRGTFHCHTDYSDGRASIAAMAEGALARGWRYLGIADHSQAAGYAGGLSPERLREQQREIDAWNAERGDEIWLFKGVEADILMDGTVDYAEHGGDVLGSFDYVVASIHSGFRQDAATMTARVLRALDNPFVTFLGHPTGRLLLTREPYALDVHATIEKAAAMGKGIEINADPHRLDLDWRWWRAAKQAGVVAAIDPDAHSVAGLDNVHYGVGMARKGGLSTEEVVNSWELERVREHFRAVRERTKR